MATSVTRPPHAINVIESEEILQYLSPSLLKLDYNNNYNKILWITSSTAFFTFVFAGFIFICKLIPAFRKLSTKIQVFLSLSLVRAIFGIFAFIIGSYATFYTTNLHRDVVFGKTATASVGMLVTTGFFIFELTTVVVSDIAFKSFSKMLTLHHGLGVILYIAGVSLDVNFCNGCTALILEMSTPFSCLCYVLLKVGMENTLLWKINQMILIHTFHLRSVVECYIWYFTYKHWTHFWNFLPIGVLVPTYFGLFLVTFVMTPYWGYKKTQQLFNPVDWNFQESKLKISNGKIRNVDEPSEKED